MKIYKISRPTHTMKAGERDSYDIEGVTQFAGSHADAREARIKFEAPFKALKPKDRPEGIVNYTGNLDATGSIKDLLVTY